MIITKQIKREIAMLGKMHTPGEIRKLMHNKGIELPYSQVVYYADLKKAQDKQRAASKRHYYKNISKAMVIENAKVN